MALQIDDPGCGDDLRQAQALSRLPLRRAARSLVAAGLDRLAASFLGLGALVVLGGVTAAGVRLKTYLERDARFRIAGSGDIQATGLTEVSRAEMLPVFGEDIGRNIFFVPLNERRKQLEQIPWVEHATVMRLLPDQIRVRWWSGSRWHSPVTASRSVWSMPTACCCPCRRLPWRASLFVSCAHWHRSRRPPAARKARMAVYVRLMAELDSSGKHYSEQISEIDLTDPEDARVLMPEQGADILAHFGEDRFLERYQRYQAHIAEWRQQYPHLAAVDLRYDQQVVLQMASGATNATADGASDTKPRRGIPARSLTQNLLRASPPPTPASPMPRLGAVPSPMPSPKPPQPPRAKRPRLTRNALNPAAPPCTHGRPRQQGG